MKLPIESKKLDREGWTVNADQGQRKKREEREKETRTARWWWWEEGRGESAWGRVGG